MSKSNVMDLIVACHSFPKPPASEILRETSLDTVERLFNQDNSVVVIEGEEGLGKTVLLAQFARRYPNSTISLFVKPSRLAHDPQVLRYDLCNQLEWTLNESELSSIREANDTYLRDGLLRLHKLTRKKTVYFVVDGLCETPETILRSVLDMLPLGFSRFRFLFSGDMEKLSKYFLKDIQIKPHLLAAFSLPQTRKYFSDMELSPDIVKEIHTVYGKIPGRLASARRSLESGVDIQVILDKPDWFDAEWSKVNFDNKVQLEILAVVAYAQTLYSTSDVARLLGISVESISESLRGLSFVTLESNSSISFVSESFRKYAKNKLHSFRGKVEKYVINDLLENPTSDKSLKHLPTWLRQAGKLDDLLEYLSPDNFIRVLEYNQSLVPVKQKADMGINAARELDRNGDLLRFSLQKSTINEMAGAEVWRSEIEARMALNDYESALALAQSVVLKEDRLHLLAVIAKAKREQGFEPEIELQEQIRQLYRQIDLSSLGGQAIEIAVDLVYSNPDLAIDIVEKSSDIEAGWALAKLSGNSIETDDEKLKVLDSIRQRVGEPNNIRFSIEAALMLESCPSQEIISKVEKIKDKDKLFFLCRWLLKNRERNDAYEVIRYTFNLVIGMSPDEYIPARTFRQIATPLPYVKDKIKAEQLVSEFDGQLGLIERLGPTEDYIRLQLLLAHTEARYNFSLASDRLIDLYQYIEGLKDLIVRSVCLARLVAALPELDPDMDLQKDYNLHSLTGDNLDRDIVRILSVTAEQYQATRGIIRALAKSKPELAYELSLKLNMEIRRDEAFFLLFRSSINLPLERVKFKFISKVIDSFQNPDLRDEALVQLMGRLYEDSKSIELFIKDILPFVDKLESIRSASSRCHVCCLAYCLLTESGNYTSFAEKILTILERAWQSIDARWQKIDVGFKIVDVLAPVSLEMARKYLDMIEKLRDAPTLDTNDTALTYMGCIQLAIRAYSGLLLRKLDTEDDMLSLKNAIGYIPSHVQRAGLWAKLSLYFYIVDRYQDCKKIVSEHVRPLLQGIPEEDTELRYAAVMNCAPALYCAHQSTARQFISELPPLKRESAYTRIILFLFRKLPLSEPYQPPVGKKYDLSYEDISEILELLRELETDSLIYSFIESLVDSISNKRNFSYEQMAYVKTKLNNLVDVKLPDVKNIQHEGFTIISKAQIARIGKTKPHVWVELLDAARSIPNSADRAFVLAIVAAAMPTREARRRDGVFDEALGIIELIPFSLDKLQRYEALASMAVRAKKYKFSKKCIDLAQECSAQNDDPNLDSAKRRLVDLAYVIDEDYALSVAERLDDDPARARSKYKRRLEVLKLQKEMSNSRDITNVQKEDIAKTIPQVAWRLLGSLNGGNRPIHIKYTQEFVELASTLPLSQAYPTLAWVIENARCRYAGTDQAEVYLRPIYEATMLGTQLAAKMTVRSSQELEKAKSFSAQMSSNSQGVYRVGDREKVIEFLREWFENQVEDYLKICDPYFGPEQLEVLQLLRTVNPRCQVKILTSQEHHRDIEKPWSETYRSFWRTNISLDQEPPITDIVILGTKSGKLPIHDRWWLTKGAGLRMGPFAHLGIARISEVSSLPVDKVEALEREVDQYLNLVRREYDNQRLEYNVFTL